MDLAFKVIAEKSLFGSKYCHNFVVIITMIAIIIKGES